MVKNLIKRLIVGVVLAGVMIMNVPAEASNTDVFIVQYWQCIKHNERLIQKIYPKTGTSEWYDVNGKPINGKAIINDRQHTFNVVKKETYYYARGKWNRKRMQ